MAWQYSGSGEKSAAEAERLTRLLSSNPAFNCKDLAGFSHVREAKYMDKLLKTDNPFQAKYGWRKLRVDIHLPKEKVKYSSELVTPKITVNGIRHCDLMDIIINTFENDAFLSFHMTPFTQKWKPNLTEDKVMIVYSEAYLSPMILDTYTEINSLPRAANDNLKCVVAPIMLWSDSTHLTSFGDVSMWPFYFFFWQSVQIRRR